MAVVCLSLDQDWSPAWATRAAVEAVLERELALTLFVTHACPSLEALRLDPRVELGLHPNFLPGSSHGASPGEVLDCVSALAPEAVGIRAHGLVRGTALLCEYARRGWLYDSSDLLFGATGLRPVVAWNDMVQLPITWEDDVELLHGRPPTGPALAGTGLRVLDFHPVLLALNAPDLAGYRALKSWLAARGGSLSGASESDLARFANRRRRGVRDILHSLLDRLATGHVHRVRRLDEVAHEARQQPSAESGSAGAAAGNAP